MHSRAYLLALLLAFGLVGIASADPSPSPSSNPAPLRINESGTYTDIGVWLYHGPSGYGFFPGIKGTNENIAMPTPSPSPGLSLDGVQVIRHPFDTLGYPMHISLLEKLFASLNQVDAYLVDRDGLWRHVKGTPYAVEASMDGHAKVDATAVGPMPADGPIPPQYKIAFDFASSVLKSIANLPDAQKDLKNYAVLFVETKDTIWMEFAPVYGQDETPHLGCQTQMGRDMVFGYDKKQSTGSLVGKFLQCF